MQKKVKEAQIGNDEIQEEGTEAGSSKDEDHRDVRILQFFVSMIS